MPREKNYLLAESRNQVIVLTSSLSGGCRQFPITYTELRWLLTIPLLLLDYPVTPPNYTPFHNNLSPAP